jgi:excisionase family DNA binding protein
MADEYLTVAEVATELKVNEQTVRNWIDRGELPAVRVGSRRVRVRRPDLEAFGVATSGAGSSEAAGDNADQGATVTIEGDVVSVRVPAMTTDERVADSRLFSVRSRMRSTATASGTNRAHRQPGANGLVLRGIAFAPARVTAA